MTEPAKPAKPARTPVSLRRNWIMQQVAARHVWPTPDELMEKYSQSQRSAYYDIEAVTRRLARNINVERLRIQVFGRLEKRVPDLSDKNLVQLALRFMPLKVEEKYEGTQEVTVTKSGMSLEEIISLVSPEQRSTVLNALRAAWGANHPAGPET